MSRSTFFTRTSTSTSKSYRSSLESQEAELEDDDQHPLALRDLSPRSSHSIGESSKRVSPSPPPSFYRDSLPATKPTRTSSKTSSPRGPYHDDEEEEEGEVQRRRVELSLSPARTRDGKIGTGRKIMFAAPPPPIATSVLLQPSQYSSAGRPSSRGSRERVQSSQRSVREGVDPLLVLKRREKSIQRELQSLLDAQSAGLIQGFGGSLEEGSEVGSNTPTTSRSLSRRRGSGSQGRSGGSGIVPVRQPKTKPLGLKGARRGLLREMIELAGVKEEENQVLGREIERRDILLRKIDTWESRIATTKTKLSTPSTNSTDEDLHIHHLEEERNAIDSEIQDLQNRLHVLRNRRASLNERIKEGINKREARLSSYRGALRDAEAEVQSFLHHPPLPPSIVMGEEEEGFHSLPPPRRTLSMAREWWEREQAALSKKKSEAEREKSALQDGVKEWEACVKEIITFEDALRAQMKGGKEVTEADLKQQIDRMSIVIDKLEKVRKVAENQGWNLLLCAVGAEAEAFKQGRGILMGALGLDPDEGLLNGKGKENAKDESFSDDNQVGTKDEQDDNPPADLLNGLEDVRLTKVQDDEGERAVSEDEDEGPNLAELLVDNSVSRA